VRLIMEMPDRPGMLGDIATRIGNEGGNIIEVAHHRLFTSPTVQAAQLEVMIEARDAAHADSIEAKLRESYIVHRL
jgi:threonine dehydratase